MLTPQTLTPEQQQALANARARRQAAEQGQMQPPAGLTPDQQQALANARARRQAAQQVQPGVMSAGMGTAGAALRMAAAPQPAMPQPQPALNPAQKLPLGYAAPNGWEVAEIAPPNDPLRKNPGGDFGLVQRPKAPAPAGYSYVIRNGKRVLESADGRERWDVDQVPALNAQIADQAKQDADRAAYLQQWRKQYPIAAAVSDWGQAADRATTDAIKTVAGAIPGSDALGNIIEDAARGADSLVNSRLGVTNSPMQGAVQAVRNDPAAAADFALGFVNPVEPASRGLGEMGDAFGAVTRGDWRTAGTNALQGATDLAGAASFFLPTVGTAARGALMPKAAAFDRNAAMADSYLRGRPASAPPSGPPPAAGGAAGSAPVAEPSVTQSARPRGKAPPSAAPNGPPVLNAVPAAPVVGREDMRVIRDTSLILGRLMRSAGVKNDVIRGYLPGLIERYKSLGESRIPLARFVESDVAQNFPEGVAGDIVTKLRGFLRERGSATGPKDTSRYTVQDTIGALRGSQKDHLTDIIRENTYKKDLIDAEDKIRATMRENAQSGYETALQNGVDRFAKGRATADEAAAYAKLEGLMKSEPFLSRIPEYLKVRAIQEGVPLETKIEMEPFHTAHWLQSALGKAERAAEGPGGKATPESLLYGELRKAVLDPLQKAVPGYSGARRMHGDLFGADEAIDFGSDIFRVGQSEIETARKVRDFKRLSPAQQTVATMSIRDALLNEFRGTPEEAAAKLTRIQKEGTLDAVEKILGADGRRITSAIRNMVDENEWLRAVDQGSGSATFNNLAGAAASAENVRSPLNKGLGKLGDKGSYPGALIGDAALMAMHFPPVLTLGKIGSDIAGNAGVPGRRVLSRATKGLMELPPERAALPPPPRQVRAPRSKPTPEMMQSDLEALLKEYDATRDIRTLKRITALRKQLEKSSSPAPSVPPPRGPKGPPTGSTSNSPAMIGGAALGGLVGAQADQDNPARGAMLGAIGGGALAGGARRLMQRPPRIPEGPPVMGAAERSAWNIINRQGGVSNAIAAQDAVLAELRRKGASADRIAKASAIRDELIGIKSSADADLQQAVRPPRAPAPSAQELRISQSINEMRSSGMGDAAIAERLAMSGVNIRPDRIDYFARMSAAQPGKVTSPERIDEMAARWMEIEAQRRAGYTDAQIARRLQIGGDAEARAKIFDLYQRAFESMGPNIAIGSKPMARLAPGEPDINDLRAAQTKPGGREPDINDLREDRVNLYPLAKVNPSADFKETIPVSQVMTDNGLIDVAADMFRDPKGVMVLAPDWPTTAFDDLATAAETRKKVMERGFGAEAPASPGFARMNPEDALKIERDVADSFIKMMKANKSDRYALGLGEADGYSTPRIIERVQAAKAPDQIVLYQQGGDELAVVSRDWLAKNPTAYPKELGWRPVERAGPGTLAQTARGARPPEAMGMALMGPRGRSAAAPGAIAGTVAGGVLAPDQNGDGVVDAGERAAGALGGAVSGYMLGRAGGAVADRMRRGIPSVPPGPPRKPTAAAAPPPPRPMLPRVVGAATSGIATNALMSLNPAAAQEQSDLERQLTSAQDDAKTTLDQQTSLQKKIDELNADKAAFDKLGLRDKQLFLQKRLGLKMKIDDAPGPESTARINQFNADYAAKAKQLGDALTTATKAADDAKDRVKKLEGDIADLKTRPAPWEEIVRNVGPVGTFVGMGILGKLMRNSRVAQVAKEEMAIRDKANNLIANAPPRRAPKIADRAKVVNNFWREGGAESKRGLGWLTDNPVARRLGIEEEDVGQVPFTSNKGVWKENPRKSVAPPEKLFPPPNSLGKYLRPADLGMSGFAAADAVSSAILLDHYQKEINDSQKAIDQAREDGKPVTEQMLKRLRDAQSMHMWVDLANKAGLGFIMGRAIAGPLTKSYKMGLRPDIGAAEKLRAEVAEQIAEKAARSKRVMAAYQQRKAAQASGSPSPPPPQAPTPPKPRRKRNP